MKTYNIDYYKDIEYRYLQLFRDCTLSKEFSPVFLKFNNTILFLHNMFCAEESTKKEKVLKYLSELYETTEE